MLLIRAKAEHLRHKQPVRHRFYRRRSRISGPARLIDLGHGKITPGAIDEAQVEGLAVECSGAGGGTRGLVEAERWRAPLDVAGLAMANLTPHALLGRSRRIILDGQAYSAL